MHAVDPNVVVRFLTADDDEQFARAKRVFAEGDVLLLTTVILETEWVLRSNYGIGRQAICDALRRLSGQQGVHVEEADRVRRALDLLDQGVDFADALHLAGSAGLTGFISFDRPLARRARALGTVPGVVEP